MLKRLVSVPSDQIVINPFAANVTNLLAFAYIERIRLTRIRVLNRVACAVLGMEIDLVLFLTPLSIKTHVVVRHFVKRVRFTRAKGIIVPAKEHIACKLRRDLILGSVDVCLVVNTALSVKIRARLRGIHYRIAATINENAVAIGNVPLVTLIADVDIVVPSVVSAASRIRNGAFVRYSCPLTTCVIEPVRINREPRVRFGRIPCSTSAKRRRRNQVRTRIRPFSRFGLLVDVEFTFLSK